METDERGRKDKSGEEEKGTRRSKEGLKGPTKEYPTNLKVLNNRKSRPHS